MKDYYLAAMGFSLVRICAAGHVFAYPLLAPRCLGMHPMITPGVDIPRLGPISPYVTFGTVSDYGWTLQTSAEITDHTTVLPAPRSRGMVCGKARPAEPTVLVDSDAFSDAAVRGLIGDWLVPAIVDRILRDFTGETERVR